MGSPFVDPPFITKFQYYEMRRVVPAGYTWNDFARLAPSREALNRALFLPSPSIAARREAK
jgi:hypothetical protein